MFKKKRQSTVKKSIHACVLASSTAIAPSCPFITARLFGTNQKSTQNGMKLTNRSKSVYVSFEERASHRGLGNQEISGHVPLVVVHSRNANLGVHGDGPRNPTTLQRGQSTQQRIQTAPTKSIQPKVVDFLDQFKEEEDIVERPDEWVNSSIKLKAQHEKYQPSTEPTETWDDDFEQLETNLKPEGLTIPDHLKRIQTSLQTSSSNIKAFSLHIQDLKISYQTIRDLNKGLETQLPRQIETLSSLFKELIEKVNVLVDLADVLDETKTYEFDAPTSKQLQILNELLGHDDDSLLSLSNELSNTLTLKNESTGMKTQDSGLADIDWDIDDLDDTPTHQPMTHVEATKSKNAKFQLNPSRMPHLISQTVKLKGELEEYKNHLRNLAMKAHQVN